MMSRGHLLGGYLFTLCEAMTVAYRLATSAGISRRALSTGDLSRSDGFSHRAEERRAAETHSIFITRDIYGRASS